MCVCVWPAWWKPAQTFRPLHFRHYDFFLTQPHSLWLSLSLSFHTLSLTLFPSLIVAPFNFDKQMRDILFAPPVLGVKSLFAWLPFVWPYHLSKKVRKRIPQIEYLHKFIETASQVGNATLKGLLLMLMGLRLPCGASIWFAVCHWIVCVQICVSHTFVLLELN